MKVTVIYKKKALEVDLSEEAIRRLEALSNEDKQAAIEKIAIQHLKRYGDKLGFCLIEKRRVDTRECLDCSIRRGNTKIAMWEVCKTNNLKPTEYR